LRLNSCTELIVTFFAFRFKLTASVVNKDGELIEFGDKEQIINNPQKEYTKLLLNAVINLK